MAEKYDAIVVGAGLGGLSTACWLAKKGFNTLLLERHNVPGGYATSFMRGRFEFEISLHELSDIGTPEKPGMLRKDLDELGVTEKVGFVQAKNLYRSVFPDLDVTLPTGREAYLDTLCKTFPDDAEGIKRFLDRIFAVGAEVNMLGDLQSDKGPGAILKAASLPFRLHAIPRYMMATWGEVLNQDVKSPQARAVISQYWGYFGLPPGRVSFFYFAIALASYITLGASHIKGRSQSLSSAFLQRFTEMGGTARMNCGVAKIILKEGVAAGVVTEAGETIEAPIVASNADPITTCMDMIGIDQVPPAFMKQLGSMEVGPSSINVYMGVAKPWESFGVNEHEGFINSDYDFDSHYEAFSKVGPPKAMLATLYNAVLPEISPPGTSMVVLTTLVNGKPWTELAPEKYIDAKMSIADNMISTAEKILPGLREYTEVAEVATPLTNMRYTGMLGGAIYGFNSTPLNHTILRMQAKGPIPGLYFTGVWSQPGGGYSPAIMSGKTAALKIASNFKSIVKKG